MAYRPVTYQGSGVRDILALNAAQMANRNQLQQGLNLGFEQITGAIGNKADQEAERRTGEALSQLAGAGDRQGLQSVLEGASGGQRVDTGALQQAAQNRITGLQADERIGLSREAGARAGEKVIADATQREFTNKLATSSELREESKLDIDQAKEVDRTAKVASDKAIVDSIWSRYGGKEGVQPTGSNRDKFKAKNQLIAAGGLAQASVLNAPGSEKQALEMDTEVAANNLRSFDPKSGITFADALKSESKNTGISEKNLTDAAPEATNQFLRRSIIKEGDSKILADADFNINEATRVIGDPRSTDSDIQKAIDMLNGSKGELNKWADRSRKTLNSSFISKSHKDRISEEEFGANSRLGVVNDSISSANKALSKRSQVGAESEAKESLDIAKSQKSLIEYGSTRNQMISDILEKVPKGKKDETKDNINRFVDDKVPVLVKKMVLLGFDSGVAKKVIVDNASTGERLFGLSPFEFVETVGEDVLNSEALELMRKNQMDLSGVKWKDGIPEEKKPSTTENETLDAARKLGQF